MEKVYLLATLGIFLLSLGDITAPALDPKDCNISKLTVELHTDHGEKIANLLDGHGIQTVNCCVIRPHNATCKIENRIIRLGKHVDEKLLDKCGITLACSFGQFLACRTITDTRTCVSLSSVNCNTIVVEKMHGSDIVRCLESPH